MCIDPDVAISSLLGSGIPYVQYGSLIMSIGGLTCCSGPCRSVTVIPCNCDQWLSHAFENRLTDPSAIMSPLPCSITIRPGRPFKDSHRRNSRPGLHFSALEHLLSHAPPCHYETPTKCQNHQPVQRAPILCRRSRMPGSRTDKSQSRISGSGEESLV
jgi:hypothetical protein